MNYQFFFFFENLLDKAETDLKKFQQAKRDLKKRPLPSSEGTHLVVFTTYILHISFFLLIYYFYLLLYPTINPRLTTNTCCQAFYIFSYKSYVLAEGQ